MLTLISAGFSVALIYQNHNRLHIIISKLKLHVYLCHQHYLLFKDATKDQYDKLFKTSN